jgi:hypothetical protein
MGAPEPPQLEIVWGILDPFGDGNRLQLFGDPKDTSQQCRLAAAFAHAVDEGSIDRDKVDRKPGEMGEYEELVPKSSMAIRTPRARSASGTIATRLMSSERTSPMTAECCAKAGVDTRSDSAVSKGCRGSVTSAPGKCECPGEL